MAKQVRWTERTLLRKVWRVQRERCAGRFYWLQTCFRVESACLLGWCVVWLGYCFPAFRRNVPPSFPMLRVRDLTHNPEDERSIFLRNFWNKSPNHTTQQPRRPSSTITRRKFQITVFVLLRIYLFSDYFIFLIHCVSLCMIYCI